MAPPPSRTSGSGLPRLDLPLGPYDDPSQRWAEALDRATNYALSRVTLGLSPAALAEAYFDWLAHLAAAPGKQLQLCQKALRKSRRLWHYAATCALTQRAGHPCIEPLPNDKRFRADAWRAWPYNVIHQAFLLQQQWWHNATTGVRGVTPQHERQVEFATRQVLDVFSPANFVLTNPRCCRGRTPRADRTWCAASGISSRTGSAPSTGASRWAPMPSRWARTWGSRPARWSFATG
jgi:hypothetical protein